MQIKDASMQEDLITKERSQDVISKHLHANKRIYYFDLKKNLNGQYYFTISETQPFSDGFKRMRLVVHREHLSGFIKTLTELESETNELESETNELESETNDALK